MGPYSTRTPPLDRRVTGSAASLRSTWTLLLDSLDMFSRLNLVTRFIPHAALHFVFQMALPNLLNPLDVLNVFCRFPSGHLRAFESTLCVHRSPNILQGAWCTREVRQVQASAHT